MSRLHFKIETIESIAQNFGIVDYIHETTPLIWYERGLWADRQNCVKKIARIHEGSFIYIIDYAI